MDKHRGNNPLAEVSHVIKHNMEKDHGGFSVIMKHSKWNSENGSYEPNIWLPKRAEIFMKDWCFYRYELEGGAEGFKGQKHEIQMRM